MNKEVYPEKSVYKSDVTDSNKNHYELAEFFVTDTPKLSRVLPSEYFKGSGVLLRDNTYFEIGSCSLLDEEDKLFIGYEAHSSSEEFHGNEPKNRPLSSSGAVEIPYRSEELFVENEECWYENFIKKVFRNKGAGNNSKTNSASLEKKALASMLMVDTDGDSVADVDDDDDDNDGILDINERPCFAFSDNFGIGSGSPLTSHPNVSASNVQNVRVGTNADFPSQTWLQSNSGTDATGDVNGRYLALDNPLGVAPVLLYSESLTVQPNEQYSYSLFAAAAKEESGRPLSDYPNVRMQVKDGTGAVLQAINTGAVSLNWTRYEFLFTSTTTTVTIEVFNNNINAAYNTLLLDEIAISLISCDTDGDGTPDYLDTDSDNDGCLDAIEGNENVAAAQLDGNGRINITTQGGVDANGVPNLVNSGGAADAGGDQGQGLTGNEIIATTAQIDTQPNTAVSICTADSGSISVGATSLSTTTFTGTAPATVPDYSGSTPSTTGLVYQWQVQTGGAGAWSNLTNSGIYSDVTTTSLTITNPTTGVSTNKYRVVITSTLNECINLTSGESTLTVNTTPTAPTASAQAFCSADSPTVADLVAAGTGIQWYAASTGGTALAGTTALSTGTYYASQTVSSCESSRTSVSVTVNTTPSTPTASAQAFCSADSPTVADLVATGTGIQWYAASTGGTALAGTTALSTGTYYASQTVSNCESSRTSVSVTVNTTPTAPTASAQAFCSVDSPTVADLVATGTGIQWYAASTGGTALAGTTALSTGTYYASQTVSNCESSRTSVSVTVNTTPSAPTASAQAFCSADSPTVADLVATGTGIQWYAASTGGTALAGTTALSTGTYYASQTVSSCESSRTSVSVTVNTTPTAPTASAQAFCSADSPTVADLVATGTGIQWYAASTGGTALAGTTALSTGTYYASQTVSSCESSRTSVSVTVNTTPTAPTASAQAFCSADSPTVADLVATGTGIQWYAASTGGTALAGTTALSTGTYYASQTVSSCESSRTSVSVTINTTPSAPTASAQAFCSADSPTVADLVATGTGIQWYAASTGGTALAGTTALSTGTYYASQTVSSCESSRTSVSITVNTTPSAPTASAQVFCSADSPTVADLVATGTGIQWYAASTGGTALAGTTALSTGTYYASQTVSSCESSRTSVSVTVNTTPSAPTASAQAFCSADSPTVADLVATGTGIQWYAASTGGTALAGTTALSTGTYYASQTVSSCESSRTSVSVTINTTPTAPTASAQAFCSADSPTVADLVATGTGIQWYAASTGGTALAGTTALSTGTYYASQTVSSCESSRTSVSVTVNTTPTAPTASAQAFCSADSPTVADLVATGTGIQWYAASTGGTALAGTTALSTGTYYASQTVSSCESSRTSVSVTVNTTPTAPTASAQAFCSADSPTVADLVATGTGIQWYAASTGGTALAGTTALSTGTYYASQTVSSCESSRTSVSVTVNTTPSAPSASAQAFCSADSPTVADLVATGTGIQWYAASTGGTVLAGTTALSTGTYYASQTVSSCESSRTSVSVTVNTTPTAPTASAQAFCSADSPTVADLVATGTGIQWYAASTGGTALAGTTALSTGTYYASQTVSSCESTTRTMVNVTVTPVNTVSVASSSPTVPYNTVLPNITHTTTGATGIGTVTGLPAGVTASWSSNTITISGTPTVSGVFNYSIALTGGCGIANATGTITVTSVIDAVADDFTGTPITVGDSTSSVVANDTLDGNPVVIGTNPGEVTLTGLSVPTGLTLNPDGTITVNPGITAGNYTVTYQICENGAVPANCDSVTVNIRVDYDTDGDGIWNADDLDDDNDGILDSVEMAGDPNKDTDGDGIIDSLDLDSDGDGISDLVESGQDAANVDADGDGKLDSNVDADNDGIVDTADANDNDTRAGGSVTPVDTDGDGNDDYQDVDSDNDGVSDLVEGGSDGSLDADNDGVIDDQTDTDGDGIADSVDPDNGGTASDTPDTDGDGQPDYQDLDSDNDGLNDVDESGGTDADGDGQSDSGVLVDGDNLPDGDGDGTADVLDPNNPDLPGDLDTDGDGVIDDNTDSDGDGIADALDGDNGNFGDADMVDTDGDGIPDIHDLDDDNDGILDSVEMAGDPNKDTDGDGIIDSLDLDSDGDGISDLVESGQDAANVDADGDGKLDSNVDADNDGIVDTADANDNDTSAGGSVTPVDTDGDGNDDYQDVDSDNDGVSDLVEGGSDGSLDADNDGVIDDQTDTDGDGIADSVDPDNGGTAADTPDTDGDGQPDYQDLDSDNDGLNDVDESGGTDADGDGQSDSGVLVDGDNLPDGDGDGTADVLDPNNPDLPGDLDTDGDGVIDDNTDSDGDGIADALDGDNGNFGDADMVDTDGDGIPDVLDLDDDNDGILDSVEMAGDPNKDTDGDGIIDSLDLDSDGDGISDLVESGQDAANVDADGDGKLDSNVDADNDGIVDTADANDNDTNAGGSVTPVDTDGDGNDDYQDVDSDNDGVSDLVEGGSDGSLDADNDGMIDDQTDTDGDGIADSVDPDNGGTAADTPDTDGDGQPDYQDLDSDNDGLNDVEESGGTDADGDGQSDSGVLVDGDNLPDGDGDGTADVLDPNNPDLPGDLDTDGDGVIDDNTDSDGDGIADALDGDNGNFGDAVLPDTDGDGIPDIHDLDDDNDGILDSVEMAGDPNKDTDGDGIIDSLDLDSDGDGISDLVESGQDAANVDADGDGKLDSNVDADNDGIVDTADANDNDTNAGGSVTPVDTDGDGNDDYQDVDSDNDGVSDLVEGGSDGSLDADNDGVIDDQTDTDGDGIADSVDSDNGGTAADTPDTDGDGHPDYQDVDSDDDGINDLEEGGSDSALDSDGDGMIDDTTDADGDGMADAVDPDNGGSPADTPDTDGDGAADYQDVDDDGDGVLTEEEDVDADGNPSDDDTDGDGTPDYLDTDDDGDGIATEDEHPDDDGDGIPLDALDTDEDGTPDYLDPDTLSCLTVYNEFSPNQDGNNDTFVISCIGEEKYKNNRLEIFNRWGNLVYSKNRYDNSWDGTSNGRLNVQVDDKLPSGTYYYVLDLGDGSKPKAGWIYINRD